MKSHPSKLHGVVLIEQDVHDDERGWSCQPFSLIHHNWWQNRGQPVHTYVAYSNAGTFRGMHWQNPKPQAKFVHCVYGCATASVLDLRQCSPTFGQTDEFHLNRSSTLYVPHGFAFGYECHVPVIMSYLIHGEFDSKCARRCNIFDRLVGRWREWIPKISPADADAPNMEDVPNEALFLYNGMDTR